MSTLIRSTLTLMQLAGQASGLFSELNWRMGYAPFHRVLCACLWCFDEQDASPRTARDAQSEAESEWDVPALKGSQGQMQCQNGTLRPVNGPQDTDEQVEASRTVKVRTKALSQKTCFEYRDFGRCQYGRNCKFLHLRHLPAPRAAPGTPPKETPTRQEKPQPEGGSVEGSTSRGESSQWCEPPKRLALDGPQREAPE